MLRGGPDARETGEGNRIGQGGSGAPLTPVKRTERGKGSRQGELALQGIYRVLAKSVGGDRRAQAAIRGAPRGGEMARPAPHCAQSLGGLRKTTLVLVARLWQISKLPANCTPRV